MQVYGHMYVWSCWWERSLKVKFRAFWTSLVQKALHWLCMLCLWNYIVLRSFTLYTRIRCNAQGQLCSAGEAELPFPMAVNLTNCTGWAHKETMPQVLGLFEDGSVYPDIWRNASQGWGKGWRAKGTESFLFLLSSPGLQPGNILEAGEYIAKIESRYFCCRLTWQKAWKSWGPVMQ